MASRWQALVVLVSMVVLGCGSEPAPDGESVTAPDLPDAVAGLSAAGEPELYDTESIFAYINGHAEVYLAYGMRRCVSQRYVEPGGDGELVVDLFEMATPADAFGVFSHDRAGETAAVGNGGVVRHGWLSFWQASWYVSVYADRVAGDADAAVVAAGEAVAAALPAGGAVPDLVSRLPADGLDPASVCFLRSPQILNAHVFVGADNPFGLGAGAEAVVGRYELDGGSGHLVIVDYPSETAAVDVEAALRAGSADRPAMTAGRRGDVLTAVVGDIGDDDGIRLLEAAMGGGS